MINYHFVFCPRYRRKLFLVDGFEARFKELVTQICEQNDIVILAMECHIDHCHLFVNAPPTLSAAEIMKESLQYNMETLNSAFPAFLEMHENTKRRLQAVGSSLPASIGF